MIKLLVNSSKIRLLSDLKSVYRLKPYYKVNKELEKLYLEFYTFPKYQEIYTDSVNVCKTDFNLSKNLDILINSYPDKVQKSILK